MNIFETLCGLLSSTNISMYISILWRFELWEKTTKHVSPVASHPQIPSINKCALPCLKPSSWKKQEQALFSIQKCLDTPSLTKKGTSWTRWNSAFLRNHLRSTHECKWEECFLDVNKRLRNSTGKWMPFQHFQIYLSWLLKDIQISSFKSKSFTRAMPIFLATKMTP